MCLIKDSTVIITANINVLYLSSICISSASVYIYLLIIYISTIYTLHLSVSLYNLSSPFNYHLSSICMYQPTVCLSFLCCPALSETSLSLSLSASLLLTVSNFLYSRYKCSSVYNSYCSEMFTHYTPMYIFSLSAFWKCLSINVLSIYFVN